MVVDDEQPRRDNNYLARKAITDLPAEEAGVICSGSVAGDIDVLASVGAGEQLRLGVSRHGRLAHPVDRHRDAIARFQANVWHVVR